MSPAGRPKAEKPKEVRFSVRLDNETHEKLQEYCAKEAITKGEAIRRGLRLLFRQK